MAAVSGDGAFSKTGARLGPLNRFRIGALIYGNGRAAEFYGNAWLNPAAKCRQHRADHIERLGLIFDNLSEASGDRPNYAISQEYTEKGAQQG